MTRVTVFGATGVQGAAQVAALARSGHHPVAVSRTPKPLEIDGMPIETVAADFQDEDGIARALKDTEVVFLNLPSTSFQVAEPLFAGVRVLGRIMSQSPSLRLVVFNTSMPVPDVKLGIKSQDDRIEIRAILRDLGLPVISLQPGPFLENLFEGWAYPSIAENQTIVYCHKPDLQVTWICHHDIAQLMIAAMDKPDLVGRNIPIGGAETVRLSELAEKLSKGWGRDISYVNQTVDDFCDKMGSAMKARSGLDVDTLMKQMHKAYTYYNEAPEKPFLVDMEPVLEMLPVTLTPIEEWGRQTKDRLPPPRA